MPSNFPSCPRMVSWLGRVAPLTGTTLCRFSNYGTPGHYTVSEPTSSLKTGSALPGDSPSTLTWQAGAPGRFPGCPCPTHCPRGQWRPGPRIMRATRAHYAIPAPHGPLAYRGRLARCTGYPLSDTHRSQPRSQPVNRAPAPLQTGFEPTFAPTAKRPPFCQFD